MSVVCYKCKACLVLIPGTNITRNEECHACHNDLHCCKMCEFYDPKHYNECKETQAERMTDKEKKNFCDYFKVAANIGENKAVQSAMDLANSLFKK